MGSTYQSYDIHQYPSIQFLMNKTNVTGHFGDEIKLMERRDKNFKNPQKRRVDTWVDTRITKQYQKMNELNRGTYCKYTVIMINWMTNSWYRLYKWPNEHRTVGKGTKKQKTQNRAKYYPHFFILTTSLVEYSQYEKSH